MRLHISQIVSLEKGKGKREEREVKKANFGLNDEVFLICVLLYTFECVGSSASVTFELNGENQKSHSEQHGLVSKSEQELGDTQHFLIFFSLSHQSPTLYSYLT